VEGVRGLQAQAARAAAGEPGFEVGDGILRPTDDAEVGTVRGAEGEMIT
jgi:hypothetical protein